MNEPRLHEELRKAKENYEALLKVLHMIGDIVLAELSTSVAVLAKCLC